MSYGKKPESKQRSKKIGCKVKAKGQFNLSYLPVFERKPQFPYESVPADEIIRRFKSRFRTFRETKDGSFLNAKQPDMALIPRNPSQFNMFLEESKKTGMLNHINALINSIEYENLFDLLKRQKHAVALDILTPDGNSKRIWLHQFVDALSVLGKDGITMHMERATGPVVLKNKDGDMIMMMGVGGEQEHISFVDALNGKL